MRCFTLAVVDPLHATKPGGWDKIEKADEGIAYRNEVMPPLHVAEETDWLVNAVFSYWLCAVRESSSLCCNPPEKKHNKPGIEDKEKVLVRVVTANTSVCPHAMRLIAVSALVTNMTMDRGSSCNHFAVGAQML